MQRLVVLGAGVIGLSAALHLLERYPREIDLTVVSEAFSPNTTSDKAGSIILNLPNTLKGDGASEEIRRWSEATFRKYHSLYSSEENANVELVLQQGYIFFDSQLPDPWYKDIVFGFRHVSLDSDEAKLIHVPPNTVDVWSFSTYSMETTNYLQWLQRKIKELGGKFRQEKVQDLNELASYDIIVNCTGLGSRELLNDEALHPLQGQVVVMRAPWIRQWVFDLREGYFTYIIPRIKDVVLGGTAVMDEWSENPSIQVKEDILLKCQDFFPSLSKADVIGEWTGLRPLRDTVRLETSEGPSGSLLVHCYGHGGQGVVFSWGCALDIGDKVAERIHQKAKI